MRACSIEYGVVSITTSGAVSHAARAKPCDQCPWRIDQPAGRFPAEAFRESAPTSYDMAEATFGCHMSPPDAPATCAGFLLRHASHNLRVRLSLMSRRLDLDRVDDGGHALYATYREMAIANGVDADDPVLERVRGNDDP